MIRAVEICQYYQLPYLELKLPIDRPIALSAVEQVLKQHPEIGLVDKREVLGKVIFLFLPGTNGTDSSGQPNEERDFGRIGVVD